MMAEDEDKSGVNTASNAADPRFEDADPPRASTGDAVATITTTTAGNAESTGSSAVDTIGNVSSVDTV